MKINKRRIKRIIREAFTEEKYERFDYTMAQFEKDFEALCIAAAERISEDGNHNKHEALELLGGIAMDKIEELFDKLPM